MEVPTRSYASHLQRCIETPSDHSSETYTEAEQCAISALRRMLVLRYRQLISKLDVSLLDDLSILKRCEWSREELNEMCLGLYDRCVQDRNVGEANVTWTMRWLYKEGLLVYGTYTERMWKVMMARVPRLKALYHVVEREKVGK